MERELPRVTPAELKAELDEQPAPNGKDMDGHMYDADVAKARHRLMEAVKAFGMDPVQAGMAAYINGVLASARIDSLVSVYLDPPNATWNKLDALNHRFAISLDRMSDAIEAQTKKIQVAQDVKGVRRN